MPDKTPTPLDTFKSSVLAAASAAIAKEMTPEQMQACAKVIIEEALSQMNASPYYTLGKMVKEAAEKAMIEQLKTPETTAIIKASVEKGVNEGLAQLPGEVRGRVVDLALKKIGEAIQAGMRERY